MKRYFIDANILIDFLACRLPFAHHAQQIFEAAEQGRIKVFVSSHSIASVYYVLRKYSEEKQLRKAILALMENSSVIALNDEMIVRSLRSAGVRILHPKLGWNRYQERQRFQRCQGSCSWPRTCTGFLMIVS